MSKFKAGDRVYYKNDVNDTGTIIEPAGHDRWLVMWGKTQVRLSVYEHNLNLIEEKNVKFKVGDRVKLDYCDDFGTIIGYQDGLWRVKWDNDTEWRFDDALGIVRKANENVKTNFKVGDRVRYLRLIGTIIRHDGADGFQVEWDDLNSYKMWLTGDVLALAQESGVHTGADQTTHSEDMVDTYTVAEFKKLLDKMDDNLILKMTDLCITFKI